MRSVVLAVTFAAALAAVAMTRAAQGQITASETTRTFIWENGDSFTGTFRNGRPNGPGVFRTAAGEVHSGEWRDGCLVSDRGSRIALFTRLSDCPKLDRRQPAMPSKDFFR